MLIKNEYGTIDILDDVFADIVSNHIYGVHGMTSKNRFEELVKLLKRDSTHKGVKLEILEDDTVNIELHIVVRHGVNIAAAGESVMSEVRYNIEEMTGAKVGRVDVYVDAIMTD
jgi:uncharacterized alkaline shock family protein YloU